ncbi:NAD-dependent epimerase/dehydratase family protein [Nocardioides mesophilus]|uniref:NAD-dependent epimerase/dehydratase family protein n=1 Tax=Nocardioides mesophilus TaxID=433659 RepID=A0A7G9RA48_9ACTN|nr:NAD-dependent epimerase/dehydratase family protein [Nocardioides mesophilus]QNN52473.1 NAD-dependent epimerase/dehydratase family protein [Nocardioides mesophilus]
MRILMIGGTRFVGRHVAEKALERGHEVTIFHRGRTGADLFPGVEHRIGDRDTAEGLAALAEGEWDATVDTCAYVPRQVHQLADALGDRGGHHLLVSSISAYAAPDGPGTTEDTALIELDDPTVEEVTGETYGGLKVLCEQAAVERHGPRTLLVRPSYVVGPDDYTWRFPWWVARIARGGRVPVPGPADAPAQVIDARDMGEWMVQLLEDRREGAFHAASPAPPFTWRQQMEVIVDAAAPAGTELVWVDQAAVEALAAAPGTVPLWSGGDPDVWVMAVDPSRAYATGLSPRPLSETVRDTLAWIQDNDMPAGTGLSEDQERLLLDWQPPA